MENSAEKSDLRGSRELGEGSHCVLCFALWVEGVPFGRL